MSLPRSTSPKFVSSTTTTKASSSAPGSKSPPAPGSKDLQERLHILLSRLARTTETIKVWPESDGDSTHVETTTKLIGSVHELIVGLRKVEGVIKADATLRQSLARKF
jgi:hypothetical protein